MGTMTEDVRGNKIFMDKDGAIVRKFNDDGKIFDDRNNEIGCAVV